MNHIRNHWLSRRGIEMLEKIVNKYEISGECEKGKKYHEDVRENKWQEIKKNHSRGE